MERRALVGLVAAAVVALAGVLAALTADGRPDRVTVTFAPAVGDQQSLRYEIEATITRSLEGDEPDVTKISTVLAVDQKIIEVDGSQATAEVTLRRDGGPARTAEVRLDHTGAVRSIDLVGDLPVDDLGLGGLADLIGGAPLPPGPVAVGDSWTVEGSGSGEARLERLDELDGEEVAVVTASLSQAVDEEASTGSGTAHLRGSLGSEMTTSYGLDGSGIHRAETRAEGRLQARISPPPDVDAAPVDGLISYVVRVRLTRLP